MPEHTEITVRSATGADVDALVAFNRAMALETESKELATDILRAGVENLLREPRYGFYVVAEHRGADGEAQVVASLMVTYEWSDWRNGLFWWIQSVYVKPQFRRRGIYRSLYEYVRELAARQEQVCGFRLYVEKENRIAQRTYTQLGMEETHYKLFEELTPDATTDER